MPKKNEQLVHRRFGEAEITFEYRAQNHSEQQHVNQLVAQRQVKNAITDGLKTEAMESENTACLRPPEDGQPESNDCA